MHKVSAPRAVMEAELARYLAAPTDDPPAARTGAERDRVIPLFNDFEGCWALAMSGQLVFFGWEGPSDLQAVSDNPVDLLGSHVALAVGSRRYPALKGIRPERKAESIPCTSCDGSGRIAGAPENLICACGGLGWMPGSAPGAM